MAKRLYDFNGPERDEANLIMSLLNKWILCNFDIINYLVNNSLDRNVFIFILILNINFLWYYNYFMINSTTSRIRDDNED